MKQAGWASLVLVVALVGCESADDAQMRGEALLNQQRIEVLKRGNDSLTREREVIFWARFKTPKDLPCFDEFLSANHYTVQYKSEVKDDAFPHKVEFSRPLIPTLETMNQATASLIPAARACNGVYQEWEAPVVP